MIVADIMAKSVISVGPGTAVPEVARIMLANGVSALPVLGPTGDLIGIVSERDLMRRAEIGTDDGSSWWLRSLLDRADLALAYTKAHALHARDVMTREVVSVRENTTLREVIDLFERHNIKRLPVVARGKLVGIVSRFDVLRAVAAIDLPDRETHQSDRDLRERVLAKLKSQAWWRGRDADVMVQSGLVYLWGHVGSHEERDAARVAAEGIPGVRGIKNHMAVRTRAVASDAAERELGP